MVTLSNFIQFGDVGLKEVEACMHWDTVLLEIAKQVYYVLVAGI